MNRLILIGNGFDLAHGMKTSYNDFILWYLKKCFEEAFKDGKYGDNLIEINQTCYYQSWKNDYQEYFKFVDHYFKDNIYELFKDQVLSLDSRNVRYNAFQTKIKSKLFNQLLSKCQNLNWVDIENEFYEQLKEILLKGLQNKLGDLNESLKLIIEQIELYLISLSSASTVHDYSRIFSSPIYEREICTKNLGSNEVPESTAILNFNYTETPKKYLTDELRDIKINYIHGRISDNSNRLIFGFGDELDNEYSNLELQKSNEFLKYIKSFWYFKTANYHNLVRFIQADEFQVYILGHSCGLSDRTMLNMIFEHKNCVSIKIFYYVDKEGNDNYTDLTYEISRHFKDKTAMREKIVSKNYSEKMPQF